MRKICKIVIITGVYIAVPVWLLAAQQGAKSAPTSGDATSANHASSGAKDSNEGKQYSGMYTFLKEGEYVQITVEDAGQVTGFISQFADGGTEKGAFVDQFFKSGKLDGGKLSFTTTPFHGRWFEFNGVVDRGEGKDPGDDAYYILKGTLTENTTGTDKKVTAHAQDVIFKMFPQEAEPKN